MEPIVVKREEVRVRVVHRYRVVRRVGARVPAVRCSPPRNIHVAAAAAPRPVPAECRCGTRGGAAARFDSHPGRYRSTYEPPIVSIISAQMPSHPAMMDAIFRFTSQNARSTSARRSASFRRVSGASCDSSSFISDTVHLVPKTSRMPAQTASSVNLPRSPPVDTMMMTCIAAWTRSPVIWSAENATSREMSMESPSSFRRFLTMESARSSREEQYLRRAPCLR